MKEMTDIYIFKMIHFIFYETNGFFVSFFLIEGFFEKKKFFSDEMKYTNKYKN